MMEQRDGGGTEAARGRRGGPELAGSAAGAWDDIARPSSATARSSCRTRWIEGAAGFNSDLFAYARRSCARPTSARSRTPSGCANTPTARCRSCAQRSWPQTPGLSRSSSRCKLSFSLERMREYLGPDHPIVKAGSARSRPDERGEGADRRLEARGSQGSRMTLFEGGQAAVTASTDPMIALARADRRRGARAAQDRTRTRSKDPKSARSRRSREARFKVYGTSLYPDATFTLRLSVRRGAGLDRNRHAASSRSPASLGCTNAPPARRHSRCRSRGSTPSRGSI